jgi:hypothetical protein
VNANATAVYPFKNARQQLWPPGVPRKPQKKKKKKFAQKKKKELKKKLKPAPNPPKSDSATEPTTIINHSQSAK